MAEPITTELRTSDGVVLAAEYWPSIERTLGCVVAHGFTGSGRSPGIRAISTQLSGAGLGVLAPDLRGHGRSAGRSTVGDLEIHDIAAAVARLRTEGYGSVAVLGWSMGGSIVLRHAGLGGDADAVVSISSPGHWFERGTRPLRAVHWACETRSGRLVCRLGRGTRLAATGWSLLPESPVEVVGRIPPTPLLIVHGEADRYFPARHAHLLAAAAPEATLWLEPGMGHAETATSPELVSRLIAWLRGSASMAA